MCAIERRAKCKISRCLKSRIQGGSFKTQSRCGLDRIRLEIQRILNRSKPRPPETILLWSKKDHDKIHLQSFRASTSKREGLQLGRLLQYSGYFYLRHRGLQGAQREGDPWSGIELQIMNERVFEWSSRHTRLQSVQATYPCRFLLEF